MVQSPQFPCLIVEKKLGTVLNFPVSLWKKVGTVPNIYVSLRAQRSNLIK